MFWLFAFSPLVRGEPLQPFPSHLCFQIKTLSFCIPGSAKFSSDICCSWSRLCGWFLKNAQGGSVVMSKKADSPRGKPWPFFKWKCLLWKLNYIWDFWFPLPHSRCGRFRKVTVVTIAIRGLSAFQLCAGRLSRLLQHPGPQGPDARVGGPCAQGRWILCIWGGLAPHITGSTHILLSPHIPSPSSGTFVSTAEHEFQTWVGWFERVIFICLFVCFLKYFWK